MLHHSCGIWHSESVLLKQTAWTLIGYCLKRQVTFEIVIVEVRPDTNFVSQWISTVFRIVFIKNSCVKTQLWQEKNCATFNDITHLHALHINLIWANWQKPWATLFLRHSKKSHRKDRSERQQQMTISHVEAGSWRDINCKKKPDSFFEIIPDLQRLTQISWNEKWSVEHTVDIKSIVCFSTCVLIP